LHGIAGVVEIGEAATLKPAELIVVQVNRLPSGGNSFEDFDGLNALIRIDPKVNVAGRPKSALGIESPDRPSLQKDRPNSGCLKCR
jgi:hypothetical protein